MSETEPAKVTEPKKAKKVKSKADIMSASYGDTLIPSVMAQHGLQRDAAITKLLSQPVNYAYKTADGVLTRARSVPGGRLSLIQDRNRHGSTDAPCRVMVVNGMPYPREAMADRIGGCDWAKELLLAANRADLDPEEIHCTCLAKHAPAGKRPADIPADLVALYKPLLMEEIARLQPEIVVLSGAKVVKAVFGAKQTMEKLSGRTLTAEESPLGVKTTVMPDPASVIFSPRVREPLSLELARVRAELANMAGDDVPTEYVYCRTMAEARDVIARIMSERRDGCMSIDCEWGGKQWMSGKLRCLQIGWMLGKVAVFILRDAAKLGSTAMPQTELGDNEGEFWKLVGTLLPGGALVGHFIRADLPWLKRAGLDIDDAVLRGWDTGLAGHLLNENWMQGLEVYTARYTKMGRYDTELAKWRSENLTGADLDAAGYANIPGEILYPYAAADADTTYRIFAAQLEEMADPANEKIAKLFTEIVMPATLPILEMEMVGMAVDTSVIEKLSHSYTAARAKVLADARTMLNWPAYNPDSPVQKAAALFGEHEECRHVRLAAKTLPPDAVLGSFRPVKTTKAFGAKDWGPYYIRAVQNRSELPMPKSDKETIANLLQTNKDHKLLHVSQSLSALGQAIKAFTGAWHDTEDGGFRIEGGLLEKTWEDGRVHTTIRQTVETGRYGHSDPNMSQMPKTAEERIGNAIDDDVVPDDLPTIRSSFPADDGQCLIDCDWAGAELFVMAWLSGDREMQAKLTAKGADFHSEVAIKIFRLTPMPEGYPGGVKAWVKDNGWSKQRTIAKTIVFGIAYGRGAKAIAAAVYLEGVNITEQEAQEAIDGFKEAFPDLTVWLEEQEALSQSRGYVENGFGRRRRFDPSEEYEVVSHQKRQAMNAPIQGTVGDLMSLALVNLYKIRKYERPHLQFKILMSVHDQILVMCPVSQVDETLEVVNMAMCERCRIPGNPLLLKTDPEVVLRWGVPLTDEDIRRYPELAKYKPEKKK